MGEIKTGKIDSAVYSHDFGTNPVQHVHNVVIDGAKFQSWAPKVLNLIGQTVSFEVIPSKNPAYPDRIKLIDSNQSGGGRGEKSGPDPEITAKNTILMQLTEIAKTYPAILQNPTDALEWIKKSIEPVWVAYNYKKPETATPAQPAIVLKTLSQLLAEIKIISSMPAFSSWWLNNQNSIKALSQADKQVLFAEKGQRTSEIECQEVDSGEIPF